MLKKAVTECSSVGVFSLSQRFVAPFVVQSCECVVAVLQVWRSLNAKTVFILYSRFVQPNDVDRRLVLSDNACDHFVRFFVYQDHIPYFCTSVCTVVLFHLEVLCVKQVDR